MLKKKSRIIIASIVLFIFILCMAEVIHSSLNKDSPVNESSLIEEEIIESPIEEEEKPHKKEEKPVIDYQPVRIVVYQHGSVCIDQYGQVFIK